MEPSDVALVRESRSGSSAAFERLMSRYERGVFSVAFSYTKDHDHALDITQEVFLKVHRKLDLLREDRYFRTWLFRIAVNESINWVRSRTRLLDDEELAEEGLVDSAPAQEDLVERRERRELLAQGLSHLAPKHRLAVVLRYFEEMSIREIGEILECNPGVVKSILFRSLKKMQARLKIQAEVPS